MNNIKIPKGQLVQQAINAIIRPPRRNYVENSLPIYIEGPNGEKFVRNPLKFRNERKQKIVGSIYIKSPKQVMDGGPCIIYLHGNASSQMEGQFLVPNFCLHDVAVFCFDFAGCGNSDGDYISLGFFESKDLDFLINILSSSFNMGPFVLWGRSMGAETALLCNNKNICCKIVDSAYTSIPDVCKAIAESYGLPSIICQPLLWFIKGKIEDIAKFDISTVSALEAAKRPNNVPLLMCHAVDDEFVPFNEGVQIMNVYTNPEKKLYKTSKGHNGIRSNKWLRRAFLFAFRHLNVKIEDDFEIIEYESLREDYTDHFSSYEQLIEATKQINSES